MRHHKHVMILAILNIRILAQLVELVLQKPIDVIQTLLMAIMLIKEVDIGDIHLSKGKECIAQLNDRLSNQRQVDDSGNF